MQTVKVTELRLNLPIYLKRALAGEEIGITVGGKVIARLVREEDPAEAARKRLEALPSTGFVGDVISPIEDV